MDKHNNFNDSTIYIIGLGYVGLTLGVAMADRGFKVHGVEIRKDILDMLSAGEPHFWEPRLKDKLERVTKNGKFTFSDKLGSSSDLSVFIITVGTPLSSVGKVRTDMIKKAALQVAQVLNDDALVILRSTVKLGTTREIVKPILDSADKRYRIAYCPERTLEGRALIELNSLPQVVGADDVETRGLCAQLFGIMTTTTVTVNSLESAELVKLVDNTYRDLTFGFANEIAKLCTHIGISAHEVIQAGKLGYPRTNVPMPGPVGGPCLEKDPHILVESARKWSIELPITVAGRMTNQNQPKHIVKTLLKKTETLLNFPLNPVITLVGLAFKGVPETDDLRGTMALPIYQALKKGFPTGVFRGYDSVVKRSDIKSTLGFSSVDSLKKAFEKSHIVIILNNHVELQNMDLAYLVDYMERPSIVYDLWNMHTVCEQTLPEDALYLGLGSEKIEQVNL